MKNRVESGSNSEGKVSRRNFIGQTAAAAVGFAIVPRRVLGGAGYVPPSDKVNIAFIGVGAQGLRVMLHFLGEPDVQGVAVCDPNKASADYPQWGTHEFCHSVRKLLSVDTGWDWLSPDQPIDLRGFLHLGSAAAKNAGHIHLFKALFFRFSNRLWGFFKWGGIFRSFNFLYDRRWLSAMENSRRFHACFSFLFLVLKLPRNRAGGFSILQEAVLLGFCDRRGAPRRLLFFSVFGQRFARKHHGTGGKSRWIDRVLG